MSRKSRPTMNTVVRIEDIPKFKSEQEESDFWASHELSDEVWNEAKPVPEGILPPARPRTRPVAIRFDESTLGRLKRLSAHLHKGYQTLLKEFVVERLYEEEKREGFIAVPKPTEVVAKPASRRAGRSSGGTRSRRPSARRKAGQ